VYPRGQCRYHTVAKHREYGMTQREWTGLCFNNKHFQVGKIGTNTFVSESVRACGSTRGHCEVASEHVAGSFRT